MDVAYKKIGILDHGGFGNLGNAAIQEALMANIKRRLPDAVFIGFSDVPDDTRKRHNIMSYPIKWSYPGSDDTNRSFTNHINLKLRLKSFVKNQAFLYAFAKPISDFIRELVFLIRSYNIVRSLDLLIILGTGQLSELWGGPWSHPFNIFKFSILAKLSNTALFILNVGAGPLEHPLSQFFAKWSVRLANYTTFRDTESQALVQSLGVKTKTLVYPDTAYSLDLKDYVTDKPPNRLMLSVGLNPMGFCDPRIWPRKDYSVYYHYLDKLTSFLLWLLAQNYNLTIFTSDIVADKFAIEDLKQRLSVKYSEEKIAKVFQPPCLSLKKLLLQMSRFDLVITSKFHGLIFSHLLSKPVITLSYHNKIDTLMKTVGHYEYCLDIERFDVNSLIDTFNALVRHSHYLKSQFRETAAIYFNALQVQFDNLFLAERQ
jgi:polysaccharide pyruvyl transferase WcaK-like protein